MEKFNDKPKNSDEEILNEESDKNSGDSSADTERNDTEYHCKVIKFFNNRTIKGYEDDSEAFLLNSEMESDLKKLTHENNLENLKPEEYSFALSYLIGQMEHDLYKGNADLEINKENEIRNQQAKELFMESCKKIYPDVDEAHPTDLKILSHNLSELRGTLFSDDKFNTIDVAEIRKSKKMDPNVSKLKNIAEKMQEMIVDITRENNDFVYNFQLETDKEKNEEDIEFVEEYKKKKALINEYIYEFMLIRDIVYEKLYGDKNVSVEGAKNIDKTREEIKKK
ncbi:MAG: hypothetical protein KAU07_01040 [Candidatus Andersenbacteria bacterium]|nr:hypothetical protein [Candidatus Andersenbacteria bacterium]